MWKKVASQLKDKKYSVYKLSNLTGIPESTLRSYRDGREPSFKNMCKIADALNVSLDYFRETEDDK